MDTIAANPVPDKLHDLDLEEGLFSQTNEADLRRAFANFAAQASHDHICVFFHGGLVTRQTGLENARCLEPGYLRQDAYPFFFIWNSDLHSVISDRIEPYQHHTGFVKVANLLVKLLARKVKVACNTSATLKAIPPATLRHGESVDLVNLEKLSRPYDRTWAAHVG